MRLLRFDNAILNAWHRSRVSDTIADFGGLDQRLIAAENCFSVMENMSDNLYPAISTRPKRGAFEQTFTKPKGILYKNGLFYIDGTNAYYKGTQRFTVTDTDKKIIGMGAYIVVFPDGKIFNTADGTVENIKVSYTQSSSATIAPLSDGSAYTKITITGIGNTFKQGDAVTVSGCTNSNLNGTKIIASADTNYIVLVGQSTSTTTQASGIRIERKLPDMDYVVERDNRIWGCSSANHEIYSCKLGDPKNWYAYESGADMAYAVTVGSDGDFTGIAKYSNFCLFFKEATIHILRGNRPANYSLTEKALPGIKSGCDRSVQVIDEILYYVGIDGVYAFNGAVPEKISYNITDTISDAVSSTYKGKLYISCKLNNNQRIIVYDPKTRIWDVENDDVFKFADVSDGMLHYVDGSNRLTSIEGSRSETVEFNLESVDITNGSFDQKFVSKIRINLWMEADAELSTFIKYDDEPMWDRKTYIRSTHHKTFNVPIIPRRCGKYKIRLSGKGHVKILGMIKEVEMGSEMNGSIQRRNRQ